MEEEKEVLAQEAEVEEKKTIDEAPLMEEPKEVPVEEESDFADELPAIEPVEEKTEEKPEEAKIDEAGMLNGVNLYKVEDETPKEEQPSEEEPKEPEQEEQKNESGLERLEEIEPARKAFQKVYKAYGRWKWIGALIGLALIVAGWLIPRFTIPQEYTTVQYIITLGVAVLVLIVLIVYSQISKRKTEGAMREYFLKYYEIVNAFVFGSEDIENLNGALEAKLADKCVTESGLYADVNKVGSRETLEFDYKKHHVVYADAAASTYKQGEKQARTAFVGKYMVFDNEYDGETLVIYLKGNKRAIPPNNLSAYEMLEDKKDMVVYGQSHESKAIFTQKVRKCLKAFETNAILIDVAISIKPGSTYVSMGYEDSLMVLPLEKPFDSVPNIQHESDMRKLFKFIDALDEAIDNKKGK